MTSWPDGYAAALAITVDVDGDTALTARDPGFADRQKSRSVFEYGPLVGAPRLLDLFTGRDVRATWFVPGVLGDAHPQLFERIAGSGHALGLSGWALERFDSLSAEQTRDVLGRARAVLPAADPIGFRLPLGEWPRDFAATLLDAGFAWSSSWLGDDLPVLVPATDGRELVDVPQSFALDDRVAFGWNVDPPIPVGQSRIADYEATFDNWRTEIDAAADEGLCTVLSLHAELSGGPGRIGLLAGLLDHVRSRGDVWIAGCDEIARWWTQQRPLGDPDRTEPAHPVRVFGRLAPDRPL